MFSLALRSHLPPQSELFISFPVLVAVAAFWLVVRALSLLRKPRSELMDVLGIVEPILPEVVVDRLGDTWCSIYWLYPNIVSPSGKPRKLKIKKQVLRIGNRAITVSGDSRRVLLSDLTPNTTYEVTVQPVHSSSVSAPCGSLYLHTLASIGDSLPPIGTVIAHASTPDDDIGENANTILKLQGETRDVMAQYVDLEAQYMSKQQSLATELKRIQSQRKADEIHRAQLRAENKALEDDDHALEVQVNKLKLQAAKVAKYRADSDHIVDKIVALEQSQSTEKADHEQRLEQLSEHLRSLQREEMALQESIRHTAHGARAADATTHKVRQLISKLRSMVQASVDNKIKVLKSKDANVISENDRQRLIREIQLDSHIEREWSRAQQSLEKQYVDAYLRSKQEKRPSRQITPPGSRTSPVHSQVTSLGSQSSGLRVESPIHSSVSVNSLPGPPVSVSPAPVTPGASVPSVASVPSAAAVPQVAAVPPVTPLHVNSMAPQNQSLSSLNLHPFGNAGIFNSGVNSPLMQSAMGSGSQVLHPAPSLHPTPSFVSTSSLPSLQRMSSGQSYGSFDAFGMAPPPMPPMPHFQRPGTDENAPQDPAISSRAARDLLPADLFQDSMGGGDAQDLDDLVATNRGDDRGFTSSDMHTASPSGGRTPILPVSSAANASLGDHTSVDGLSIAGSGASTKSLVDSSEDGGQPVDLSSTPSPPKKRAGSQSPSLLSRMTTPNRSNKRTASRFFNSHDEQPAIDSAVEEEDETVDGMPMSRSPLRGMGSKFFQRSGSRSGNFVRRLSLFGRKDEPIEEQISEK